MYSIMSYNYTCRFAGCLICRRQTANPIMLLLTSALYWGFSLHFHSLQWSNENFEIIAMKTMKAMKLGNNFFYQFGPNPRFFFKKWPLTWNFIAFLMHSFFKSFQFQAEKTFKNWNSGIWPKIGMKFEKWHPRLFIALF